MRRPTGSPRRFAPRDDEQITGSSYIQPVGFRRHCGRLPYQFGFSKPVVRESSRGPVPSLTSRFGRTQSGTDSGKTPSASEFERAGRASAVPLNLPDWE